MDSLQKLRDNAITTQPVLDYIWDLWVQDGKWPKSRIIHRKFGADYVYGLFHGLNNAYLLECDPWNDPTYELRLIGMLCTSHGDKLLSLFLHYLEYLRKIYQKNPGREEPFTSKEITSELRLSEQDASLLGRLLSAQPLQMGFGYGNSSFQGWQASIPTEFDAIGQSGNMTDRCEQLFLRKYKPTLTVNLSNRRLLTTRTPLLTTLPEDADDPMNSTNDLTDAHEVDSLGRLISRLSWVGRIYCLTLLLSAVYGGINLTRISAIRELFGITISPTVEIKTVEVPAKRDQELNRKIEEWIDANEKRIAELHAQLIKTEEEERASAGIIGLNADYHSQVNQLQESITKESEAFQKTLATLEEQAK